MRIFPGSPSSAMSVAWASLIGCAVLTACAVLPQALRDLPELPPEFARDLAVADTAPVLMTRPARATAPAVVRPLPRPSPLAPAKACTTPYAGYVTYPITVCYPPSVLVNELKVSASDTPPAHGMTISPPRFFKLTSHPLVSVGAIWFCTVRSGPWYAELQGKQMCDINPNFRTFTAEILEAPETVVVVWSGTLSDVPAPLNLAAISEMPAICTCCSGVTCPDGSCAPDFQHCGVARPAARLRH